MAEGLRRGSADVGLECLVQPVLQEQVRHADGQLIAGARELCFSREPEFKARLADALTESLGKHGHDIILLKQGCNSSCAQTVPRTSRDLRKRRRKSGGNCPTILGSLGRARGTL